MLPAPAILGYCDVFSRNFQSSDGRWNGKKELFYWLVCQHPHHS